jgi:hypothetical protein
VRRAVAEWNLMGYDEGLCGGPDVDDLPLLTVPPSA